LILAQKLFASTCSGRGQRADKIIVASSGASKVPGSRRVKATTTSREPKLLRPTLETSLATVPWPLALTLPTSLPT
jgi:hypothetical protein